jgi:hypothetical protein
MYLWRLRLDPQAWLQLRQLLVRPSPPPSPAVSPRPASSPKHSRDIILPSDWANENYNYFTTEIRIAGKIYKAGIDPTLSHSMLDPHQLDTSAVTESLSRNKVGVEYIDFKFSAPSSGPYVDEHATVRRHFVQRRTSFWVDLTKPQPHLKFPVIFGQDVMADPQKPLRLQFKRQSPLVVTLLDDEPKATVPLDGDAMEIKA